MTNPSRPATSGPSISPCLWFDGDAEEAARFYVSLVPNSRIDRIQTNLVDSPSGPAGSTLLVIFTLAGQRFMAVNGGMRMEYTHALSLLIECDTQAEIDRLWDGLLEGGTPEQCGWLKDRWGVSWQITPRALGDLLATPDTARAARVMQALFGMVKIDVEDLRRAWEG
ncbi:VOC family protein [Microvirga pudoricolor]|uniref:VOC family protein n=1 Tax=Microvirga pudoricolor TaxID=2778729 RepID=UPI00194FCDC4|nr:VOC family protein [Microvirga pudoricolor]MBM6596608.1 VOC family protein [Microvirga pudoricolor]